MIDFASNHFDLLGIPARYSIDIAALEDAYRALQRDVHPDRHAASGDATRRLALQAAARVNEAYRTLGHPVERARYLLALRGVDAFDETDTALAIDFLERQLDRRERASNAVAAHDEPALDALLDEVRGEADAIRSTLASLLDNPGPLDEARLRVRELGFLDKLERDVGAMVADLAE